MRVRNGMKRKPIFCVSLKDCVPMRQLYVISNCLMNFSKEKGNGNVVFEIVAKVPEPVVPFEENAFTIS